MIISKGLRTKAAKPTKPIKLNKISDDDLQVLAEKKFKNLRSNNQRSANAKDVKR